MADESESARQNRLAIRREKDRVWREKNRDKLREQHREWKASNRDKVRQTNALMYVKRSRSAEPRGYASAAASLRWNGLQHELIAERRREFIADSIDADFANHAVVWFGS